MPLRLSAAKSWQGHAEPAAGIVGLSNLARILGQCTSRPIPTLREVRSDITIRHSFVKPSSRSLVPRYPAASLKHTSWLPTLSFCILYCIMAEFLRILRSLNFCEMPILWSKRLSDEVACCWRWHGGKCRSSVRAYFARLKGCFKGWSV